VSKTWQGNPCLSDTVSEYMISLRKRKVAKGEVSVSEAALRSETLLKLIKYNETKKECSTTEQMMRVQLNVRSSSFMTV
jgi:hypothetical protein